MSIKVQALKAGGRIGMKIHTNELCHMTNMATMPIIVQSN